jgi:Gpi18-like mannosyltransferase
VKNISGLILIFIATIAILVIIGIIATLIVWKKREKDEYEEPNYQTFFILGITFLPMGIIFMIIIGPAFIAFTGMGLCYLAIGLANRDKWRKEE